MMLTTVLWRVAGLLTLLWSRPCDCFVLAPSSKKPWGGLRLWARTRERRPDISSYLDAVDNVAASKVPKPRKKGKKTKRVLTDTEEIGSSKPPSVQTQLSYARNGHACTRELIPRNVLNDVRTKLRPLMAARELEAWRQKVEVAADSDHHSPKSAARAQRIAATCSSVAECQTQLRRLLQQDVVEVPFLQFFNTWRAVPAVLNLARGLAPTARTLLFGPNSQQPMRLYQDSIFWKRRGDGPTPWHADAPMAPFDTRHMITAWITLTPGVAGLEFCSQSHADMALHYWKNENEESSAEDEDLSKRYADMLPPVRYGPLQVGDVTWHSGWTLHSAAAASTETDRVALAITYVSVTAPVRKLAESTGDREDAQSYQDWIQEVPRGSRSWDHPLVPILLGGQ